MLIFVKFAVEFLALIQQKPVEQVVILIFSCQYSLVYSLGCTVAL